MSQYFNCTLSVCENADLLCLSCQKHICDDCLDDHANVENHEIFTEENQWNLCSQHQEQVSLFCLDCEKVICIYCTNEYFEGGCKGHHVSTLYNCVNKIRCLMFEYKGILQSNRYRIESYYTSKSSLESGLEYLEYFLEDEWTSSPLILSEVFHFFEFLRICRIPEVIPENVPIYIENIEPNDDAHIDEPILVENDKKIETPHPVVSIPKIIIPRVIQKMMLKKSRQKYASPQCHDSPSCRTRSHRSSTKRKSTQQ